jgi:transposase-like protein
MGRSRHTEAQIIAALKQVEAGRTVEDVARECGVSSATIYAWKAKHTTLNRSRHAQATIFVILGCEPVLGMRTRFLVATCVFTDEGRRSTDS